MKRIVVHLGIVLLASISFLTAIMDFLGVALWSNLEYSEPIPRPPDLLLPFPMGAIIIGYFFAMAFVSFLIFVGLISRYNRARIATIMLSPAPFFGVLLFFIPLMWVRHVAILLTFTEPSFPLISSFIGIQGFRSHPTTLLFGIFNLAIPIYLSHKDVKSYFQSAESQKILDQLSA